MSNRAEPIRSVKGTRDLLPPETTLWQRVEEDVRRVFGAFQFHEIRTPILERTPLFARSVGVDTDIVSKEMYTFQDRDDESLTLRPEATASVVRAYIEHSLYNQAGPQKLYYIGPMFRRERPQKGRYRQFYQIGAEVLGSSSATVDVEVLEMLTTFLQQVGGTGVGDFSLLINSVGHPQCRAAYTNVLRNALGHVKGRMCPDCQRRADTNPLRVFDCKVEADQPIVEKLPRIIDYLDLECRQHFDDVREQLDGRGIKYVLEPRLVRGLDYYTRTTFEITSGGLGAQNSLLGGGRYDGLSELLGGPPAPGFGFAIGEDRLVDVVNQAAKSIATQPESDDYRLHAYVAWLGGGTRKVAEELVSELRLLGLRVAIGFEPAKLKKSIGTASRLQAAFAVIVGEDELAKGEFLVKDLRSGAQQPVRRWDIAGYIKERL